MTEPVTAPTAPSRKQLLIGSAVALAVAAVGLVVFVLPAEYGIDPTGAGEALGITQLSEGEENIYLKRGQARENVLFPLDASATADEAGLREVLADNGIAFASDAAVQSDRFEIELLPYEGIELKYVLAQGAPMIFAWRSTGPVNFDMHAHPFEGGVDLTESYVITDAPAQTAVYVAPFTGIHGWYWQNRTLEPVRLTLDATGAFTGSKIFDPAGEHDRPMSPPAPESATEAPPPKD
jgi:hypothetical protein